MSSAAQMLRDEDVQEVIDRSLAKRVRTMHLAPLLGKVLAVMTEDNRHQEVLDEVIKLASRTVNENSRPDSRAHRAARRRGGFRRRSTTRSSSGCSARSSGCSAS